MTSLLLQKLSDLAEGSFLVYRHNLPITMFWHWPWFPQPLYQFPIMVQEWFEYFRPTTKLRIFVILNILLNVHVLSQNFDLDSLTSVIKNCAILQNKIMQNLLKIYFVPEYLEFAFDKSLKYTKYWSITAIQKRQIYRTRTLTI